jgi:hypothetical protein
MIQILKANQKEIIVKQGQSIYSTTPETATPEVQQALQQHNKKTTTKKTEKTTKKTNTKNKTTNKKTTKKEE